MRWVVETAMDIGGRHEQQDRVIALHSRWRGEAMVALADGMGGHDQGAAAAQTLVETVAELFKGSRRDRSPQDFLRRVCLEAHRRVRALAGASKTARPGSTCVLLYLRGNEAYWLHLGDSRLYHFRGSKLLKHTRDHSLIQLLRDQNPDAADQVASNVLYACLGSEEEPVPDLDACAITPDDWFVLCSDGFWNLVTSDEVVDVVLHPTPISPPAAAQLALMAAGRGGVNGDNVSLALARRGRGGLRR